MSKFNYSNKDLKKNLTEINSYFERKNELIIINKNKIVKFIMNDDKIIHKNMDNKIIHNNYFKSTSITTEKKITFNKSEIFNGINKPSKEVIKKYFIKPCERFSRIYSSDLCTNKLNKLQYTNLRNVNIENANTENNEENNEENMKIRNKITENNNEIKENIKYVLRHSKNNEEDMKPRNAITENNNEVKENIKNLRIK